MRHGKRTSNISSHCKSTTHEEESDLTFSPFPTCLHYPPWKTSTQSEPWRIPTNSACWTTNSRPPSAARLSTSFCRNRHRRRWWSSLHFSALYGDCLVVKSQNMSKIRSKNRIRDETSTSRHKRNDTTEFCLYAVLTMRRSRA
jgi:hypothetical protein